MVLEKGKLCQDLEKKSQSNDSECIFDDDFMRSDFAIVGSEGEPNTDVNEA